MSNHEIARANSLYRIGDFRNALRLYEIIAQRSEWRDLLTANIQLCRKRLDTCSVANVQMPYDKLVDNAEDPRIVVTMTTIRSRLLYVPHVIESILKQTLRPIRLDINISNQPYLLDEGVDRDDPTLAELAKCSWIKLNWVDNIGPYRKIWPLLEDHFSKSGQGDVVFVTIDDDTLYPPHFLEQLYKIYLQHDCVVAFRGRHIESDADGLLSYEKWSWGIRDVSLSNLPTGKDGVLYSTKFFTPEFLNLKAALKLAPTADDLWIKWHCALNGVPSIIINPEACSSDYKSFPVVSYDKTYRENSLYSAHNSSKSGGGNDRAISDLEAFYMQSWGYNLAWLLSGSKLKSNQLASRSHSGTLDLSIGIKIGAKLQDSELDKLAGLANVLNGRFTPKIVVGMAGAEEEFATLRSWLAEGFVEQVVFSGHEDLILNDLVDAAIRLNTTSAVFMEWGAFLQSPASALKFIVENRGVSTGIKLSANAQSLFADRQSLRCLPKLKYPGEWAKGLSFIHAASRQELLENKASGNFVAKATSSHAHCHLFVTETGLARFGGWSNFKASPIRVGGISVSEFAKVSILTVEGGAFDDHQIGFSRKISAITKADNELESVVFDIWPAPHSFINAQAVGDSASTINVPRQILIGRRCPLPLTKFLPETNRLAATFIMSNYNKASYIHAGLYGLMMQAHPDIKLEIVDDVSADNSVSNITRFLTGLKIAPNLVSFAVNESARGTYWIRNLIISRSRQSQSVFLINDSDDVSSAMRATLQLNALAATGRDACLFNIVRVNDNYAPLPMDNTVERYGTASLAFKPKLIEEIGYFQNIKRNADTEFIRRLRRFLGKSACPWVKYPVMLQPFDGNNLTADIYTVGKSGNEILANNGARAAHIELVDRDHEALVLQDLPGSYGFPLSTMPDVYGALGRSFLIDGYFKRDSISIVLERLDVEKEGDLLQRGFIVFSRLSDGGWKMASNGKSASIARGAFVSALKEFTTRESLHSYVMPFQAIKKYGINPHWNKSSLCENAQQLILSSKAKGDRFIMKQDGTWCDAIPHLSSLIERAAPREMLPATMFDLLHTSIWTK